MTRRIKIWLAAAVLFILANAVFAGIAAVRGEWVHCGIHVALLLAGEYVVWRLARSRVPAG